MNEIDVAAIHADQSWNCRDRFALDDVHELAEQMREHGLIQPVVLQPSARCVAKLPEGKHYRLIAGFRRFAAATLVLGWNTIPAVIKDVNDDEAHSINLIENLERKDLNVLEEARAMNRLYPRGRYTLADIAERLKKHTSWVQLRWHLLKLPEDVQMIFASGRLPLNKIDFVRNHPDAAKAAQEALDRRAQAKLMTPADKERAPRRRRKSDVNLLIKQLIQLGINDLPRIVLAWTNGHVSTDELDHAIEQYLRKGRTGS